MERCLSAKKSALDFESYRSEKSTSLRNDMATQTNASLDRICFVSEAGHRVGDSCENPKVS